MSTKKESAKHSPLIPNAETMESFYEAIDNLHNQQLKSATSYEELEKLLNA